MNIERRNSFAIATIFVVAVLLFSSFSKFHRKHIIYLLEENRNNFKCRNIKPFT
jgi:hypothetical protein